MTTSLVEGGGVRDLMLSGEEDDEGGEGMYALRSENLFNIGASQPEEPASGRETSLYIVSEGVREYSNGRKQPYLVERRGEECGGGEDEEGGSFSSPSSPNNSQALITHKVGWLFHFFFSWGLAGSRLSICDPSVEKNTILDLMTTILNCHSAFPCAI
jgi:hypothetical protein